MSKELQCYTLEDKKPTFKNEESILIDMRKLGILGVKENGIDTGKIVGIASVGLIDIWMVRFRKEFGPAYPYRTIAVPHVAIIKKST